MGPETGLRHEVSRYSLGFYLSSIIAALNVSEQSDWASVNSITGGLALSAVSDSHRARAHEVEKRAESHQVRCAVSSIVSDFYVQYPVHISKLKAFLYTTLEITLPTCIGLLLGACY